MNIYELLNKLNIKYSLVEHKPVFTSLESEFIKEKIEGLGVKNLFLKDTKDNYYILLLKDDEKADLKSISKNLNTHLSFGSEEKLKELLNLTKGSVTPLGIMNDINNKVTVLINKNLTNSKILCHPDTNTKTISIEYKDLIKFIEYLHHNYKII